MLNDFDKNNILQAILLQKRIYAHNQFQKKKMCMISEPKSMLHGEKHIVHIHVLVHERVKKNVPVPNYPHPLPRKSMVHPLLSYLTFVVIKKLCWWGNFFFWGGGACTFQLHLAQRTSWKTEFLCTLLRIVLQ